MPEKWKVNFEQEDEDEDEDGNINLLGPSSACSPGGLLFLFSFFFSVA